MAENQSNRKIMNGGMETNKHKTNDLFKTKTNQ